MHAAANWVFVESVILFIGEFRKGGNHPIDKYFNGEAYENTNI